MLIDRRDKEGRALIDKEKGTEDVDRQKRLEGRALIDKE